MKALLVSSAVGAMMVTSVPISATTLSNNRPLINACYKWADLERGDRRAVADCDRALAQEATTLNERVATLVNRGIVHMVANNDAGALSDFDQALRMDPQQPEAWLGKAIQHWKAGDDQAAVEYSDRALRLGTKKPAHAFYIRGLAHEGLGNVKAAYADLQRARSTLPSWDEPRRQLSRYRIVRRTT